MAKRKSFEGVFDAAWDRAYNAAVGQLQAVLSNGAYKGTDRLGYGFTRLLDQVNELLAIRDNLLEEIRLQEERHLTENEKPIPVQLFCPKCGTQHVDRDEWAVRPHSSHACQNCGLVWKPCLRDTVGVRFLPGCLNPSQAVTDGEPEND